MARERVRHATRGFLLLLVAAFVLLAGFVYLIIGVGTVDLFRVVLAVALLLIALFLLRAGYAAISRSGAHEENGGSATTATTEQAIGRIPGGADADDRMDP
jgi:hypothetical protein